MMTFTLNTRNGIREKVIKNDKHCRQYIKSLEANGWKRVYGADKVPDVAHSYSVR